jgi:hypothetical protein
VERLVLAAVLVVIAVIVALIVQRRTRVDAPTQPSSWSVPTQLDRNDFEGPELPWLIVTFTSATCVTCRGVREKTMQLAAPDVVVQDVEVKARPDLHERYRIDAVPTVVVADGEGVVRASFLGEPSAAELREAIGALRTGADG